MSLMNKKVLSIKISGNERKERVRSILLDIAHFKNMLIILISKYRSFYKETILNQSILYGLVAREYSGKYKEKFEEVLMNIENNSELKELLEKLKAQKEKIDNAHYIQYIIRQVIKDFGNFFRSFESFKKNPEKFVAEPRPPKPKKLLLLMNLSVEGNNNTFKREEDSLVIRLRKSQYLKVKLPKNFPYRISSIRLKLFGDDLYVDVVYEQEIEGKEAKGEYRAGIDIGLDELLSVVSENPELRSFIVSGKEIKAFNQWFNKEKEKNPTAKLPPAPRIFGYPGKLYRNLGNFRFQDVTGQVGLDHQPDVYTHGAAVADYDLDGYPDLLVTGYGRVTLWHNEPDGKGGRRFVDVTGKAGLLGPNPESRSLESNQPGDHFWSTSAAWGDLDGDGYPDLYLCQYVNWSFVKNHPPCNGYTVKVPHDVCPPKTFDSVPHALWRNRGDGTFENVTAAAGLRVRREDRDYGKGLGVLLVDVDGDLKPDIYVANDTTDNFLYLNRSKPAEMRFEDKSLAFGVARDHNGVPNGSMGVDAADFDGCGRPSIFVTNYESEYHALYRSVLINNRLSFTFSTPAAGLGVIGPNFVGFGTKFVDVDSDGWEDIVITNGHVVYYPPRDNLKQRPILFLNRPSESRSALTRCFADATHRGGSYFEGHHRGRGLSVGDLDNDGRPDLVLVNVHEPVRLLRNIAEPDNNWVGFELHAPNHRDFVGARLTLTVDGRELVRFAKGGGSYLSAHDPRILFGLGQAKQVGPLVIEWPTGEPRKQVIPQIEPGKYHRIDQK
jgi:hypothetical protein